ncbi:hypothetical protein Naga_100314g4 [Nannochloropsis gaditana]|uniref:Uncharacterized protein n=1 Tax=Nannochloropsis gaditana TaxID=72520 RepID=W7TK78_9STRA|nr:hypothetical protein Naga_100314g4 [Nannochloropsis gaditana]
MLVAPVAVAFPPAPYKRCAPSLPPTSLSEHRRPLSSAHSGFHPCKVIVSSSRNITFYDRRDKSFPLCLARAEARFALKEETLQSAVLTMRAREQAVTFHSFVSALLAGFSNRVLLPSVKGKDGLGAGKTTNHSLACAVLLSNHLAKDIEESLPATHVSRHPPSSLWSGGWPWVPKSSPAVFPVLLLSLLLQASLLLLVLSLTESLQCVKPKGLADTLLSSDRRRLPSRRLVLRKRISRVATFMSLTVKFSEMFRTFFRTLNCAVFGTSLFLGHPSECYRLRKC